MTKKNIEELNSEELDSVKGGATERVRQVGQKDDVVLSREAQEQNKGVVLSSESETTYFKKS